MHRTFRNTRGYTAVKRAIRGPAPSTAVRHMRVTPRPIASTPAAGPGTVPAAPSRVSRSQRRKVNAVQQRAMSERRAGDLATAETLEQQADRLTADRLNGRLPSDEIDAARDLADHFRTQAWVLKESHGFIRPETYSKSERDRYFVTVDPWATSSELTFLFADQSERVSTQARLAYELRAHRRVQQNLAAAALRRV